MITSVAAIIVNNSTLSTTITNQSSLYSYRLKKQSIIIDFFVLLWRGRLVVIFEKSCLACTIFNPISPNGITHSDWLNHKKTLV